MIENYEKNGVALLKGALSQTGLQLAKQAYDWSMSNPGSMSSKVSFPDGGYFYNETANPKSFDAYGPIIFHSDIVEIVKAVFKGTDAWFMYEQVFMKEGGDTSRTPWHQDTPYLPVGGDDLLVIWISFDSVGLDGALEFISGSHKGPLYDGYDFDDDDDTAPLYDSEDYPRLPDIEANRRGYDILSWATEPGDVLVFHPSILHGGAKTARGSRRRTVSLRFFGSDARVERRPADISGGDASHPIRQMRQMESGQPFRHPGFPKVY